ncbi:hypothetical protein L9G15_22470, partial [Shewanella sp. A3A]|nr:hypothetical protein [Shewanella ferrihydritica]
LLGRTFAFWLIVVCWLFNLRWAFFLKQFFNNYEHQQASQDPEAREQWWMQVVCFIAFVTAIFTVPCFGKKMKKNIT